VAVAAIAQVVNGGGFAAAYAVFEHDRRTAGTGLRLRAAGLLVGLKRRLRPREGPLVAVVERGQDRRALLVARLRRDLVLHAGKG
jgi:hypothetical protein